MTQAVLRADIKQQKRDKRGSLELVLWVLIRPRNVCPMVYCTIKLRQQTRNAPSTQCQAAQCTKPAPDHQPTAAQNGGLRTRH
jgi:hypothetical protein